MASDTIYRHSFNCPDLGDTSTSDRTKDHLVFLKRFLQQQGDASSHYTVHRLKHTLDYVSVTRTSSQDGGGSVSSMRSSSPSCDDGEELRHHNSTSTSCSSYGEKNCILRMGLCGQMLAEAATRVFTKEDRNDVEAFGKLFRNETTQQGLWLDPKVLNFYIRKDASIEKTRVPNGGGGIRNSIWRALDPTISSNGEVRSHHLLLTWTQPASYVEVCGSMSAPPWSRRYPLFWCFERRIHWIDLHEAIPNLSGIIQFKFLVDGVWECDSTYPICDDGSAQHNRNNVCVVFPQRLRARLSAQRLTRKSGSEHQKNLESAGITNTGKCETRSKPSLVVKRPEEWTLRANPAWACSSPPETHHVKHRWSPSPSKKKISTHEKCLMPRNTTVPHPAHTVVSGAGNNHSSRCRRSDIYRGEGKIRKEQIEGLVRCLSHHGRHRIQEPTTDSFLGAKARHFYHSWPRSVTDHLIHPNIMLQLNLPLPDVLKMSGKALHLFPGWAMTPHPDKVDSGGADSFYISSDHACLAIADGVGEWDSLGFSPQQFSEQLVQAVKNVWEDPSSPIHTLKHLPPSYTARELMRIAASKPVSYGSATCCIAILDCQRQQIGLCNLGDSGLGILRRNSKGKMGVIFQTEELSHFFNCPYQLSKCPPARVLQKLLGITDLANGEGFLLPAKDGSRHGLSYDVPIEEGDLIIMASDGLWDNLWPGEITSVCNLTLGPLEALIFHDELLHTDSGDVARALTEAALHRSRDPHSKTPFAKRYTAECGMPALMGGKQDDITVVAAWVARESKALKASATNFERKNAAQSGISVQGMNLEFSESQNKLNEEGVLLGRWPYRCQSLANLNDLEHSAITIPPKSKPKAAGFVRPLLYSMDQSFT